MNTKIISIKIENCKKIKLFDLKLDGENTVLSGANGSGKSSAMDAVAWVFEGKSSMDDKPVRDGCDNAVIEVDVGEYKIKRHIKKDGKTKLEVRTKTGHTIASPQKVVDDLIGSLTFDPVDFANMPKKERAETLRDLVGLDFTELDKERDEIFSSRTVVNSELKRLKTVIADAPDYPDAPVKPIDVQELWDQLREIQEEIQQAEAVNKQVESNEKAERLLEELQEKEGQANNLTKLIEEIDNQKAQTLRNTIFPVDGLSVNDADVIYKGYPFDQCADSEKIRVSTAIGMSMNSNLKVIFVRNASLLDDQSWDIVFDMAKENGYQVIAEVVGDGDRVVIVLEDGEIKEDRRDVLVGV